VDIEDITEKYTGQRLGWADLTAAWHGGDPIARMLAHAVQRAADAVGCPVRVKASDDQGCDLRSER
jgi:hypothetical protein